MEEKKIDRETLALQAEQKKIKDLVNGEGWGIVKDKILGRAASLLNILAIQTSDPASLVAIIGSRQLAAKELLDLLKDIEGTVEQYNMNSQLVKQSNDGYILHTEFTTNK